MESEQPQKQPSRRMRVWRSIRREPLWPQDESGRMRLTLNDLILHLHPPKVSARSIRFTYTFGLGGLAILLFLILIATGMMLAFVYKPTPEEAYASIVALKTDIWFGQLIRNVHHWSANLLLVVVGLHLLRVFYTAGFRTPREFNWQLGLALLGLVALANFTGYLLPWDQLAYWAVTVANSIVEYIPVIGGTISRLLIGGTEVGARTLTNFFALHIIVIPLAVFVIISFHIWRVRKDRFTIPRRIGEKISNVERVTTIPHLVAKEFIAALIAIALLLAWASFVNAPLEQAADPNLPTNPTKTAWYFMGIQELLLHFHPLIGAFVIPALTIGALVVLPYLEDDMDSTGIWFRSRRGRWLTVISLPVGVIATVGLVLLDEYGPDLTAVFSPIIATGLIPLAIVMGGVWGYAKLLRLLGANRSETRMALFTLLLAAFITLTVIGVLFRGEGMVLQIPWEAR